MAPMFRHLSHDMARNVLREQQRGCGSHIPPTTNWYCWQSHQGAEFVALFELGRQGFITYLPMFCDRKRAPARRNGRAIVLPPPILPLFPGYGFVAFDPAADQWRRIVSTRGIRRLFGAHPERPLPVPRGIVEGFIRQSGPDGYADDDKPLPKLQRLRKGAQVRVMDGAFEGFAGICQMSADHRVRVLLEVFGRPTSVEMPRHAVEAA